MSGIMYGRFANMSRRQLQRHLESRGFAVHHLESDDELRSAAWDDLKNDFIRVEIDFVDEDTATVSFITPSRLDAEGVRAEVQSIGGVMLEVEDDLCYAAIDFADEEIRDEIRESGYRLI